MDDPMFSPYDRSIGKVLRRHIFWNAMPLVVNGLNQNEMKRSSNIVHDLLA